MISIFQSRSFHNTVMRLSYVGKRPLKFDSEVSLKIIPYKPTDSFPRSINQVEIKGPKGVLYQPIEPYVNLSFPKPPKNSSKLICKVSVKDSSVLVQKQMWGTTQRLLQNKIEGVTEGFLLPLRLVGVGYRAQLEDGKLNLKLGFAQPVILDIPEGVSVQVPVPQKIILNSIDWPKVTQFAASIRKWRKPEPYNQKEFSSSSFLAARRNIPLEILVDLINNDYADFIQISTRLVGLDKILTNINQALAIFKSDIKSVELDFIVWPLYWRGSWESKILNLFVGNNESVTKVENLIENSLRESESLEDSLIDGKLVERGKEYPFVKNREWRINKVKDTLSNSLSNALKSAFIMVSLNPNDQTALDSINQLLRTYLLVDQVKHAEEAFSEVLVLPFVKKTDKSDPSKNPPSKLELVYKNFIDYTEKSLYKVINCSRKSFRGTSYDFAVDCLFKNFVDHLTKNLSEIFNPGQPQKFQKYYIQTTKFLSNFEKIFFRKEQQCVNFRASAVYIEFLKKWQIQIYFQIVSRKINEIFKTAEDEETFYLSNLKLRLLDLFKNQISLVTAHKSTELHKILEENFNQSLDKMMENLEVLNSRRKHSFGFQSFSRELPTEGSYFIPQIFQPLENFQRILNEKFNDNKENLVFCNGFFKEISSVLIMDVSSNFIKTVKKILKQTKSSEDYLRSATTFEDTMSKNFAISLATFNLNLEINEEYKDFFEEYNLERSFEDVS
ncbi:hypothetical protein HK099_005970 [Clydaea vesicula]|uniref:Conserved oligomeric Golgi complex subunit 2 n=1 Tax=Clydaea vesicula TaxID=447962 RepID=A0AAD5U0F4_9FUNG|nr:hypothetical protein HK099_005970 [Clydaea vesicula]